jgi:hypothetical protein
VQTGKFLFNLTIFKLSYYQTGMGRYIVIIWQKFAFFQDFWYQLGWQLRNFYENDLDSNLLSKSESLIASQERGETFLWIFVVGIWEMHQ